MYRFIFQWICFWSLKLLEISCCIDNLYWHFSVILFFIVAFPITDQMVLQINFFVTKHFDAARIILIEICPNRIYFEAKWFWKWRSNWYFIFRTIQFICFSQKQEHAHFNSIKTANLLAIEISQTKYRRNPLEG